MLFDSPEQPGETSMLRRRVIIGGAAVAFAAATLWWFTGRVRQDPTLGRPFEGELVRLTSAIGIEAHPSLSPDGRWVAYRSDATGDGEILLQNVETQQHANLTNSPDDESDPAFSPDGRRLAFRSTRQGGGIYVVDRHGGQPRRLTQFGASPAWTPDGQFIIYAGRSVADPMVRSGLSEGWKVEVTTGLLTRLTRSDFVQPAVSPSGRRVAYSSHGAPNVPRRIFAPRSDIWTMSTDGHHEVPATSDAAMDWSPMWSADGRHLYFISNRGGVTGLWGVRIDEGTGRTRGDPVQVPLPAGIPAHFTRALDGRRLAWSTRTSSRALHQVRFNADTRSAVGGSAAVIHGAVRWQCAEPSPDGTAVALRSLDPRDGIHIADAEGGSPRKISGEVVTEGCPRWSPDGTRIVFHGHRGDVNALWIARTDGVDARLATRTLGALSHPVWAPDGARVAAYDGYQGRVRIFDVKSDEPVTDSVKALPVFTQGVFVPGAWSPDGQTLAGTAAGAVWVYSFEGEAFTRLTEGTTPAWLNTSRRLMIASSGRIIMVDLPTRFMREILARPHEVFGAPMLSPDNDLLYFTRERSEADIWVLTLR